MDFDMLLIGFLILITVIIVTVMIDNYLRSLKDKEIYALSLENLENQLKSGAISEKTYKEIRINLDERYFERLKNK